MWYQLHIDACSSEEAESLSNLLDIGGALSVTLTDKNDDPVLEPELGTTPLWAEVQLTALFENEALAHETQSLMKQLYPQLVYKITQLLDQDWEKTCKDDFKSLQIGSRLWICPSWDKPPKSKKACTVMLDPGLAFGTGKHPTTRLCLQWLDKQVLEEKTMIDYGCGSGILAIAALRLGAAYAYALDIDPHALKATEDNAKMNNIKPSQLRTDFPDTVHTPVDVVVANILLGPLIALQHNFKSLLKADGQLVVSGILSQQIQSLIDAYQGQFHHQETLEREGWALLVFAPKGN